MRVMDELSSALRCAAIVVRHRSEPRRMLAELEAERQSTGGAPRWDLAVKTEGYGIRPMPKARDVAVLVDGKWRALPGRLENKLWVYEIQPGQLVKDMAAGTTGKVVLVQSAL